MKPYHCKVAFHRQIVFLNIRRVGNAHIPEVAKPFGYTPGAESVALNESVSDHGRKQDRGIAGRHTVVELTADQLSVLFFQGIPQIHSIAGGMVEQTVLIGAFVLTGATGSAAVLRISGG